MIDDQLKQLLGKDLRLEAGYNNFTLKRGDEPLCVFCQSRAGTSWSAGTNCRYFPNLESSVIDFLTREGLISSFNISGTIIAPPLVIVRVEMIKIASRQLADPNCPIVVSATLWMYGLRKKKSTLKPDKIFVVVDLDNDQFIYEGKPIVAMNSSEAMQAVKKNLAKSQNKKNGLFGR